MTYLVLHEKDAFYTDWFDYENLYISGMVVFNLALDIYTTDGRNWKAIHEDSL